MKKKRMCCSKLDSVLLVKEKASDLWAKVKKGIKYRFDLNIRVRPFCGNLAVILFEDNVK